MKKLIDIQVDTERRRVRINNGAWIPYKNHKPENLADLFEQYDGESEYTGIVADIQKWFYGSIVKAPWCATSLSYFANKAGILDKIGGKNENVYKMLMGCSYNNQDNTFLYDHSKIYLSRGDILFFLWKGDTMTESSSKHVTTCAKTGYYKVSDNVPCIGGNQDDKICTKEYSMSRLYAVSKL